MQSRNLFHTVRPYLSALAVIVTTGALIFTIYFTRLELEWTTFLAGILVAAILAEATRVSRAEWTVMRRTAQLSSIKDRLERESYLREKAEAKIAADRSRLQLFDEVLPIIAVLVDAQGYCRYHNHAFREWLHLRPEQIDTRHLQEITGARIYEEIELDIQRALHGKTIHADRMLTMQDGAVYHLSIDYVPQYDEAGKVSGAYILATDITEHRDVLIAPESSPPAKPALAEPESSEDNQELFIDSLFEQISSDEHVTSKVVEAIENSKFRLLYQLITPLGINSHEPRHYEVLIRLMEEEENMMPPGAFFPLAEKHGLMPYLDRWVVKHILEWASSPQRQNLLDDGSTFFINLARSTIRDAEFPAFVGQAVQEYGLPGSILCFEVPNGELTAAAARTADFIQAIRSHGCRAALSGFGRDMVSFDQIRGFQVEYLKIDGSVILNVRRNPVDLAKVVAISRVAQKIGVQTIAEFVEDDETMAKLKENGIDFAQGFGISKPHTLEPLAA